MAYPIDTSDLTKPHGSSIAADRLRLALFGFTAERPAVGSILITVTAAAYVDGLTQGGGIA